MRPFDELKAMPESELLSYLRDEAEAVISGASPNNQLKLRALQARCDHIRRQYIANKYVASAKIYDTMWGSFCEMNDALKTFRSEVVTKG